MSWLKGSIWYITNIFSLEGHHHAADLYFARVIPSPSHTRWPCTRPGPIPGKLTQRSKQDWRKAGENCTSVLSSWVWEPKALKKLSSYRHNFGRLSEAVMKIYTRRHFSPSETSTAMAVPVPPAMYIQYFLW